MRTSAPLSQADRDRRYHNAIVILAEMIRDMQAKAVSPELTVEKPEADKQPATLSNDQ